MYTLIIGKSKSRMFQKAVDKALLLGGEFDGEKITLTIKEEMKAYQTFFPLFELNVLSWKNTRAYHNKTLVDPYRFMFLMDKKRKTFYAQVLEQLDFTKFSLFEDNISTPYLYHKREGNRFFFQGENRTFDLEFKGESLYNFVDKFDVGDIVYFE